MTDRRQDVINSCHDDDTLPGDLITEVIQDINEGSQLIRQSVPPVSLGLFFSVCAAGVTGIDVVTKASLCIRKLTFYVLHFFLQALF